MKPTDCSLMVSARTSPAPACDARDPRNCSPIHAHIRPACPPSEHLACTQTHRLLCTLLTLFTYVLTGDTRQHCHRPQPLRERAEQAGRPCGRWLSSSPSSAPSARASGGPLIGIQQLIHQCAWSSRAVLLILIGPLWTDEYEYELLAQAQLPRRLPRQRSRRGAACRASAGFSVPPGAWRVRRARHQAPEQGKGPPEGANGCEPWRDGCRSCAWVGPDGARPARRVDRTRSAARRVRPLSAARGVGLFNLLNTHVRVPGKA